MLFLKNKINKSNKKKIFEEASKKTLSINLLDEGLKLKSERKNEKKEILDLLNL